MNLTHQQTDAVSRRGGNILVSAAAGAGKTRVLVERVLSYVTDPVCPRDIDDFLLITYTRAAAEEMRVRISDRLEELLDNDRENAHLSRQLRLVASAQISTLHAFCYDLLREYAALSDWPLDARVAEENQLLLCRDRILSRTIENAYEMLSSDRGEIPLAPEMEEIRDDFRKLADYAMNIYGDRPLREMVLQLWEASRGFVRPQEVRRGWLDKLSKGVEEGAEALLASMCARLDLISFRLKSSLEGLNGMGLKYEETVKSDTIAVGELMKALESGWEAASRAAAVFCFDRAKPLGAEDKLLFEVSEAVEARKDAKDFVKEAAAVLSVSLEEHAEDLTAVLPVVRGLERLVSEFDRAYRAERIRKRWLDMHDLTAEAFRLLSRPDVAETVSSRYTEILVDEYQDINPLQDEIINAVSRDNVFYVGDARQSIYRFQKAEPGIFLSKLTEDGGSSRRTDVKKLTLNFRSRPELLEAVNGIFGRLMSRECVEMDYGDPIESGREHPELLGRAVEMLAVEPLGEEPGLTLEARCVARRLRELIDAGEAAPEECAILLRSLEGRAEVFQQALSGEGLVGVTEKGSEDFFDSDEIHAISSFLALLINPDQDIPLAAVLASPVFGFTPDMLARLRLTGKEASLYQCVLNSGWPECGRLLGDLGRFGLLSGEMRLWQLVSRIYADQNWYGLYDNQEYLRAFLDMAKAAPEGGLSAFLLWLEQLKTEKKTPPIPPVPVYGGIRIMTIHKSKGLEFPVVVAADLKKAFNKKSASGYMLLHEKAGIGLKRRSDGLEYPTLSYIAVRQKKLEEALAEELRVMYVALTRAERKLILSCRVPSEKEFARLCGMAKSQLPPRAVLEAGSMADWLWMSSGFFPVVRVTAPEPGETAQKAEVKKDFDEIRREEAGYPHRQAVGLPSKMTVTGLKGRFFDVEANEEAQRLGQADAAFIPRGIKLPGRVEGLTAAEKGSAFHLVMQMLDYHRCGSKEEIGMQIREMAEKNNLDARQAACINTGKIAAFFGSSLGMRLIGAEKLWKECKFSILQPVEQLIGVEGADGDEILLQGVIDCFFQERGGMVVVDYKTDFLEPGQEAGAREKYRLQIETYAKAVEAMTGVPVVERWLYFFSTQTGVLI